MHTLSAIRQRLLIPVISIGFILGVFALFGFGVERASLHFRKVKANEILANIPSRFRVVGKSTIVNGFDGVSVHLADAEVGDDELYYIGAKDKIVALDLSGTSISSQGLEHCMHLSELRQLSVARTSLGESVWSVLNHFPELTLLNVAGTHVSGEAIPDSLRLVHLKIFCGDDTQFTDTGLERICNACPRLESLLLSRTKLTSNASHFLNRLSELSELAISDTKIGDQFVHNLSDSVLKKLHVLRVQSTDVSENACIQLKKQYPQIRIEQ